MGLKWSATIAKAKSLLGAPHCCKVLLQRALDFRYSLIGVLWLGTHYCPAQAAP